MKYKSDITIDLIKSILEYNPKSGKLIWKPRTLEMFVDGKHSKEHSCATWNARYAGREAGGLDKDGHCQISIFKKRYFVHRIIWLLENGEWPKNGLDHKNIIPHDNRINNLRHASTAQNAWNVNKSHRNKSGYKGVSFHAISGKWQAHICQNKKRIYLGLFKSAESAYEAYMRAAIQYHGEYANVK